MPIHKYFRFLPLFFALFVGCAGLTTFEERSDKWARPETSASEKPARSITTKKSNIANTKKTSAVSVATDNEPVDSNASSEADSATVSGTTSAYSSKATQSRSLSILAILAACLLGFVVIGFGIDRFKSHNSRKS